jgi:NAD(P)-dependent dehydrogenase (short-subunit alcohol dehydrogenase family)
VNSEERFVIVTGAAGGIGSALVEILVDDGDTILAVDLPGTGVASISGRFANAHGFECDISQENGVVQLFREIESRFPRIDVLFNNAAMGPTMAPTRETTVDSFRRALSVNLVGPFLMAREAVKRMGSSGAVINIASLAGVLGNPKRNAYAASKAGLISFTKSLACEWASRGVRVNAVAPGYVRTPMVAELERSGKVDLTAVRRRIPMGRMARPDEIARAARFLASRDARYITGSVLAVDGGWMSFNQPGEAHPAVVGTPPDELSRPESRSEARIVVVTGGANGIGAAVAKRFADTGDTVVIADRDRAAIEKVAVDKSSGCIGIEADISDETQVIALFREVIHRFGTIDVLVNDAAISDTFSPALDQGSDHIERILDVNLTGAFMCTREALKAMTRGGVILNVGSINTFLPFVPRHAYGASKAGIDILTRCMAAELGPEGIRTATVAPGYIRTPGITAVEQSGKADFGKIRRRIPMGEMGRPDDIADAALFLASADASYINGSILYVDGGWTSFGGVNYAGGNDGIDLPSNAVE